MPKPVMSPLTGASESERLMAEILERNGGALDRRTFRRECLIEGLTGSTFNRYLGCSTLFAEVVGGIYALRGRPVPPEMLEAARQKAREAREAQGPRDWGRTADGKLWMLCKLDEAAIVEGPLHLPSGAAPQAKGVYFIKAWDNRHRDAVSLRAGSVWGLRPLLRLLDAKPGDQLLLLLDTAQRTGKIQIGDEATVEAARSSLLAPGDGEA